MRVTSSASSGASGGRIPGKRRASIVLPVPGGPPSSRLWPPAAAISSARRARSWPRTSARSGCTGEGTRPFEGGSYGGGSPSPRRYATASARCLSGTASTPASSASGADWAGQSRRPMPARRAPSAAAMTPPTGLTLPSSASSPTAAQPASASGSIWRVAARIARAMGKSKPEPSLRRPAGARLTVIRRATGHSSSAESMPLRTRSLASWQARSASPTIVSPGRPLWTLASTSTRRESSPTSACVTVRASIFRR